MEQILERSSESLDLISKTHYIPHFVWKACKGVAIINISEVGFVFSISTGDGVVIKKNDDGSWGAPSAVLFTGAAGGGVFGATKKQIIILPMTEHGLKMLTGKLRFGLGVQAGIAAGPGREAAGTLDAGGKGVGATYFYVFERGIFVSVGINDHLIETSNPTNEAFYGKEADGTDIVMMPGTVDIPEGKGVEALAEKLNELSKKE